MQPNKIKGASKQPQIDQLSRLVLTSPHLGSRRWVCWVNKASGVDLGERDMTRTNGALKVTHRQHQQVCAASMWQALKQPHGHTTCLLACARSLWHPLLFAVDKEPRPPTLSSLTARHPPARAPCQQVQHPGPCPAVCRHQWPTAHWWLAAQPPLDSTPAGTTSSPHMAAAAGASCTPHSRHNQLAACSTADQLHNPPPCNSQAPDMPGWPLHVWLHAVVQAAGSCLRGFCRNLHAGSVPCQCASHCCHTTHLQHLLVGCKAPSSKHQCIH